MIKSFLIAILTSLLFLQPESACSSGCPLAIGSYYISPYLNFTYISALFNLDFSKIPPFNPNITSEQFIPSGQRLNITFPCDCVNYQFLAHVFSYTTQPLDTYDSIARVAYANLTTADWVAKSNNYEPTRIPDGVKINVTINCSCGDEDVSDDYGLFTTYPLRSGESLESVAAGFGLSGKERVLQRYNPAVNFSAGSGIVFVPTEDPNGSFRPLFSRKGISKGALAGIILAGAFVMILVIGLFFFVHRRKKSKPATLPISSHFEDNSASTQGRGGGVSLDKSPALTPRAGSMTPNTGITVDRSTEFTYQELSKATNDFNVSYKIGQGGFGAVYYAELRGEKAAIKKMDMQASREFLAELKVLTHVHHLNLVRLIGYCTEGSLFLVYEYIENGNLSEHLRETDREPLSWPARVQIALDSARGLEYIHEHTVPVYIHRDIKSANILIDKNYHGKVADFGLTKLTEVGSTSLQTRLVGTFGYMPPEYAQYGDVSPKVDVYAFGVVLYELISAKQAIVKLNNSTTETKALVALFDAALSQADPMEELGELVDPKLGDDCPLESIHKMAQLAKACTHENPQLRPSMRSIVVALMTLSSSTEDWDMGSFYENQALVNLMSGR